MAEQLPVSLVGVARDRYLRRLETRMEFLHDFISGHEDGWGLEGEELQDVVEHLSRAWTAVTNAEIRRVAAYRQRDARISDAIPQGGNVIPFPTRP